jgi:hypothetical protein
MSLGDKMNEMKDKAADALGKHGDKADQGIDKAQQMANDKTGGKYNDQIQKGADFAKDRARQAGGNQ